MIERYEKYLDKIGGYLQNFFEQQKPYICCKEGCDICCKAGQYPFSAIEFEYAKIGYEALSEKEKEIVCAKVQIIKKAKEHSQSSEFMYECPFLLDKKCSVYNNRGIICRTYGLLSHSIDNNNKIGYEIPWCARMGLNYSKVFDKSNNMISSEKWKATDIEVEPVSYNVGLKFMLDNDMAKELELEFGEQKSLIDWF